MLCPQCQSPTQTTYKYCPECGQILHSPYSINEDASPLAQTTIIKKKKMPFWYKFSIFLMVLALIGVTAALLFTEKLVDVVDNQLEALRAKDVEKAYHAYTSKDFQQSTTFDQFVHFIQSYPIFFNNQSAHFTKRAFDKHLVVLKGHLTSNEHVDTPVEYRLIREDNNWKILSMRLLKPEAISNAVEANVREDLSALAKQQLKTIRENRIGDAYADFTSKEFQETTSEKSFEEFVQRYPLLFQPATLTTLKPIIRNGIGSLSTIVEFEQNTLYIKYYFIFENEKWKIWSMRIIPSEQMTKKRQKKAIGAPI